MTLDWLIRSGLQGWNVHLGRATSQRRQGRLDSCRLEGGLPRRYWTRSSRMQAGSGAQASPTSRYWRRSLQGREPTSSAQDLNVVYDQTFVKLAEDPELRQRLGLDRFQDASTRFGTVQSLIEAVALAQGDESTAEQRLYLERTTGAQAGQFSADVAVYASGLQAFRFPAVQNRQGPLGQYFTDLTTAIANQIDDPLSFQRISDIGGAINPANIIFGSPRGQLGQISGPTQGGLQVSVNITDQTDAGISAEVATEDAYAAFGLPRGGPAEPGG